MDGPGKFINFPLLLIFLFIFDAEAKAEFTIRSSTIKGVNYLYFEDIARYFGFTITRGEGGFLLTNAKNELKFPENSLKAYINSTATHLSFAPRWSRSSLFLSEQDFALVIDPIVRDESLPRNNINRIVIDPGHGGKDKGAIGSKVLEKDINLILSKKLKTFLIKKGYQVLLTRKNDKYLTLGDRGKISKNWGADVFISIHCNAAGNKSVTGIETFMVTPKGSPSTSKTRIQSKSVSGNSFDKLNSRFSYEVQKALISSTNAKDRGIKYYRWQVLREASCPAILVETGFLSNPEEERKLATDSYQEKVAYALAKGISNFQHAVRKN